MGHDHELTYIRIMTGLMNQLPGRRSLRSALLLLCLLATGAVQLTAATHWHSSAQGGVAADSPTPRPPSGDGPAHDGCLLCQVAAHAGATAPPPSPWALVSVQETALHSDAAARAAVPLHRPSHSWQGRAPPRI